ncbi:hypothetical protein TorRG33x02_021820 [Trema orientale]|uniref:RNase H type-1 domain-containing protein n=1 Tax=Trema orientale TaxID=63057 RepID=A0A2P5FVS2_TREOI|nr:hypothetical protein TorRG33x02_021820 [Trema orientale]
MADQSLFEYQTTKHRVDGLSEAHKESQRCWMPPDHEKFKLNVNAASFAEMCCTSIRAIVRDHIRRVVFTYCVKILSLFDPLIAVLLAMRKGLVLVSNFGLQIQMLESDSSNAVSLVNSATDGLTAMDLITGDIKSVMSINEYGTCSFIPRSRNEAVHKLAKPSSVFTTLMYWLGKLPSCLCDVVAKDLPL